MKTHAPAAVFPAVVDSESPQTHKEKERGRESPSPSALTHTHMCNNTTAIQCTEVNKVHAYNFLVIGQCPLIILINKMCQPVQSRSISRLSDGVSRC